MNLLDLSGKIVLLTGGLGAIGQTIVKTLAEHGATVAVNDVLPKDEGEKQTAQLGDAKRVAYFRAVTLAWCRRCPLPSTPSRLLIRS
jgi:NAD(P)-dependent dehydrogenase (short-subunit alcohol dehydrogenase family)